MVVVKFKQEFTKQQGNLPLEVGSRVAPIATTDYINYDQNPASNSEAYDYDFTRWVDLDYVPNRIQVTTITNEMLSMDLKYI